MANEYFVGAINRVGVEELGDNNFYGSSYFVSPRGQIIGEAASDSEDEAIVRDLDMNRADARCATPGPSTETVGPTVTESLVTP